MCETVLGRLRYRLEESNVSLSHRLTASDEKFRKFLLGYRIKVELPYKSDIPRAVWNPPFTRQGTPNPSVPQGLESLILIRHTALGQRILEIKLDRPGRGNAIGKEIRRGLQKAFEDVSNECSANVSMICSSVPKAFCVGADLKI
ncbi:hypothetical protein BC332_28953 [Capsicum chinense]|nr:hypothetical protein BC332_28953 [Capsicum chinense]